MRPLLILISLIAIVSAPAAPLRIAIVGDSTVSEYPETRPDRGWGQYIEERFQPGTVKVINLAVPGRSTKTFIEEGRWEKTLLEKPNYVLIQFGHNDSHAPENRESTGAATDYKDYLRRYIDESRANGAVPILVTPMIRRTFDENGRLSEAPTGRNRPLGDYASAMREVGREKNAPLIDLSKSSRALVEKLGPAESAKLANKPGDATHFNEHGARTMAELVMQELPVAAPELAALLKSSSPHCGNCSRPANATLSSG